jgi:hypothetical protein
VRKIHRWLASIGMLFLAYVALTGTVLQINEIRSGGPTIIGPGAPPGDEPGGPPRAGDNGVRINGLPLNAFLQSLHNGDFAGKTGRWVDLSVGVIFMVLSVSGSVMYFQLLLRRRQLGKKQLFWD